MSLVITMAGFFADRNHVPVVAAMRAAGHEVLDYRDHNEPLDLAIPRREWSSKRFLAVQHSPAVDVRFRIDRSAIERADVVVVLVAPEHSGRASHWESGVACCERPVIIYVGEGTQPETAYLWASRFVFDIPELLAALSDIEAGTHVARVAKRI